MDDQKCRCGFTGHGDHPCHSNMYACKRPAKRRFYNVKQVALAGVQMKLGADDTWACDSCWDIYKASLKSDAK